ncbi:MULTISPECIES: substrate-binding periplasmic protein [Kordiimonas]|jgi:polar amino acid transport system substrate-binding protein|uniref:substrate-binding periplasmic protein n=1 Tax=Kordiimonas TaxID=288021 RepID=UPI00257D259F|nr:transporter substrate-binding domain-containing protein [Kordiimonas sp. UBA4487]
MLKILSLSLALLMGTSTPALTRDVPLPDAVRMTATDWPPFAGKDLPDQGASIALIRDVFARAGLPLEVKFAAWQRSLTTALADEGFVATGPVYYSKDREDICHFSAPIGQSKVGFVQRKDTPIRWEQLEDLTGVRIGAVSGYVNEAEFDKMAHDQTLDVSTVHNDALNLRRLAFGRIDLAVIDEANMRYLLSSDKKLEPYRELLEMNSRYLITNDHLICFKKSDTGEKLRDLFNAHYDAEKDGGLLSAKIDEISRWMAARNQMDAR